MASCATANFIRRSRRMLGRQPKKPNADGVISQNPIRQFRPTESGKALVAIAFAMSDRGHVGAKCLGSPDPSPDDRIFVNAAGLRAIFTPDETAVPRVNAAESGQGRRVPPRIGRGP